MSLSKYYQRLGLSQGASLEDIKRAYRKLAFKYHPDRNLGDDAAEEKFKEILEAYEELNKAALQEPSTPPRRKPVRKKASRYGQNQSNPSEPSHGSPRKRNLRYNVFISLEESLTGCSKIIRYIRSNGQEKENVQLKIQVPQGTRHRQRLKVSEFGEVGSSFSGDLYIVVHHQPHHFFEVEDTNLSIRIPVTYLQALLGHEIQVPTLDGLKSLKLKEGQLNSIYHELPNLGLFVDGGPKRGALIVEAYIDAPDKLSDEQKNTLQAIADSWPISQKMTEYQNEFLGGESQ